MDFLCSIHVVTPRSVSLVVLKLQPKNLQNVHLVEKPFGIILKYFFKNLNIEMYQKSRNKMLVVYTMDVYTQYSTVFEKNQFTY